MYIWIFLVGLSVVIGSLGILFMEGLWRFWEVMSPFNTANFIVLIILFIPVFIIQAIISKLENK